MPLIPDKYVDDSKPSDAKGENGAQSDEAYAIHLVIVEEEDGGYSAIALNLPGTGSCGDTKEEAIANAREAAKGVLESYKNSTETIPWKDSRFDETPGDKIWITVHA